MFKRNLCNKLFKSKSQLINNALEPRRSISRRPDAIYVEKCTESPIIVMPRSKDVDIIGPPNSKSNLRPIIRQRPAHESNLQQILRQFQDETQEWNEKFWNEHNSKFLVQREAYIKSHLTPNDDRKMLTPDEMSQFYKKFLDDNWQTHVKYNFDWYKRNFLILYYSIRVHLESYTNYNSS